MKAAVLAARILLGLIFFVFGLNGLLHFLPMHPLPGDAGTFATILAQHGWMRFVAVLQVIGGLLLLVGRYVPLALVILAPIVVNILLFHALLTGGEGIVPGLVCAVLAIFLIWAYRISFRRLFDAAPEVS